MRLVFDIETDHYSIVKVKNIWCVVTKDLDTGEVSTFTDVKQAVDHLRKADLLIAHNGIMYDLPVLQRLAGFKLEEWPRTMDTLILSRLFYNHVRDKHSLASWGETLGNYKTHHEEFDRFSEEMLDYCIQDVEVTTDLYKHIRKDWDLPSYKLCIDIEMDFAKILSQQVLNGFRMDIPKAQGLVEEFTAEIKELEAELLQKMQPVKDLIHFKSIVKKGLLISETKEGYWYNTVREVPDWEAMSQKSGLDIKTLKKTKIQVDSWLNKYGGGDWYNEEGEFISPEPRPEFYSQYVMANTTKKVFTERFKEWKFEEPNPYSRQQIIDHFVTQYGWEPKEKTDKGTPIVDETILDALKYPEAKLFSKLFRLNKQRSMISNEKADSGGWFSYLVGDRIHGNVNTNAAITGRCTHSSPNMAQVDKKNLDMRKCWIAKDGWDLVSVDADALEFRLLAAALSIYDGGALTRSIEEGKKEDGTDPHSRNRDAIGLKSRDNAKTCLYALIYGAGDKKLGITYAEDQDIKNAGFNKLKAFGEKVRAGLMYAMQGLDQVLAEGCVGLDGRPLYPRSDHAKLNTRIQSAGAVVMKVGLINFWKLAHRAGYRHGIDWGLTANVHDEIDFESRPEISGELNRLCVMGIEMTTKQFNLGCPIRAQGQIGKNWGEIH